MTWRETIEFDEGSPEFWDRMAASYTAEDQGGAPEEIVEDLMRGGLLEPEDCVLEVGSGPGTYSLPLARRVRVLVCMDSSEAMLERLSAVLAHTEHGKVELFRQDWRTYVPRKGYDFCLAALLPGGDSDESLSRMEGASRRGCAVVSWDRRIGDDLTSRILESGGVSREGPGRGSDRMERWLRDNGRDYSTTTYDVRIEAEIPLEDAVRMERARIRAYGITDMGQAVEDALCDAAPDGTLRIAGTNTLRMTCWHV